MLCNAVPPSWSRSACKLSAPGCWKDSSLRGGFLDPSGRSHSRGRWPTSAGKRRSRFSSARGGGGVQARRTAGVQGLVRCAHPRHRQGRGSPAGLTPRVPGLPRAYRSRRHPARKTPERGLRGHTRRRVPPGGEAEEGPCPLGLHRGSGGAAPRVREAILRASKRRQDGCVGTR